MNMSLFRLFGPPNVEKLKAQRDVRGLIKALRYSEMPDVQRDAAKGLGEIGDVRAIDPLIAALKDTEWTVRRDAAFALSKIPNPRAEQSLITALKDRDFMQILIQELHSRVGNEAKVAAYLLERSSTGLQDSKQEALKSLLVGNWRALESLPVSSFSDQTASTAYAHILEKTAERQSRASRCTPTHENYVRLRKDWQEATEPAMRVLVRMAAWYYMDLLLTCYDYELQVAATVVLPRVIPGIWVEKWLPILMKVGAYERVLDSDYPAAWQALLSEYAKSERPAHLLDLLWQRRSQANDPRVLRAIEYAYVNRAFVKQYLEALSDGDPQRYTVVASRARKIGDSETWQQLAGELECAALAADILSRARTEEHKGSDWNDSDDTSQWRWEHLVKPHHQKLDAILQRIRPIWLTLLDADLQRCRSLLELPSR